MGIRTEAGSEAQGRYSMSERKDLRGKIFTHLTVLECVGSNKNGHLLWNCKCECGNEKVIPSHKLLWEEAKSCGCMHHKYGHGRTNSRLYNIWLGMKARCFNKNSPKYSRYGGRGIKVCDEWHSFKRFYEWAVANGYSDNLSIDRINVDGDYCPENCQWLTISENSKKAWEDRRQKL